ncbi:MAG: hypothetical protein P4M07_25325 [Xanthobacteraceae bacterium]|nr:hypothetical protein [Xanthobacteraceae bacterium]
MHVLRHRVGTDRLRSVRGLIAVCMVIAWVLAGTLHGVCDLDVTNPAGTSEIASALGGTPAPSDGVGLIEHHCHGCFSIALPLPLAVAAVSGPSGPIAPYRPMLTTGVIPDPESPPPKRPT